MGGPGSWHAISDSAEREAPASRQEENNVGGYLAIIAVAVYVVGIILLGRRANRLK